MNAPASRRGFLRGLTALPLIGGGVTLIGNPTGAAEPVSRELLDSYNAWLFYERRMLAASAYPGMRWKAESFVPLDNCGARFHFSDPYPIDWDLVGMQAQARAAVVLSAVGCDWRGT